MGHYRPGTYVQLVLNGIYAKNDHIAGFEQFEFDIPVGKNGDCYDRARVRVEEMRQSLRIIEQCVKLMPEGHYKSDHPLTTPPRKENTLKDIETLITHFLGCYMGPVIPAGEAMLQIEVIERKLRILFNKRSQYFGLSFTNPYPKFSTYSNGTIYK